MSNASKQAVKDIILSAFKARFKQDKPTPYIITLYGKSTETYGQQVESFFGIRNIHLLVGKTQEADFDKTLRVHYKPPKYSVIWNKEDEFAPIDFDIKTNDDELKDIRVEVKTRFYPLDKDDDENPDRMLKFIGIIDYATAKRYGDLFCPLTKMNAFKLAYPKKRCIFVCRLEDGYYYAEYSNDWWKYPFQEQPDSRTNDPEDKKSYRIPIRLYKKYNPAIGFPEEQEFDNTSNIMRSGLKTMVNVKNNIDFAKYLNGMPIEEYIETHSHKNDIMRK